MKTLSIMAALMAASTARQGAETLVLTSNVADGETLTIGTYVFEFDTDSDVTEGNIAVDVSGGATPAAASTALVSAINSANAPVRAVASGNNVVVVHEIAGESLATSETLAGTDNAWARGSLTGARNAAEDIQVPVQEEIVVASEDVTAGHVVAAFPAAVEAVAVDVRTAAGVAKAWDGAVTVDGGVVILDNSGDTDLAATDVVTVTARLAIVA